MNNIIGKKFGTYTAIEEPKKINNQIMVKCQCECGRINNISLTSIKNNKQKCCYGYVGKDRNLSYKCVEKLFKDNGCILISKEYIDSRIPLEFICKCGNKYKRLINNFKISPMCIKCGIMRYSYEEVKEIYKKNGCKLLSLEYKDHYKKLEFVCKCGKIHKSRFCHFLLRPRCRSCGYNMANRKGEKHHSWKQDRELVEKNSKYRQICKNLLKRTLFEGYKSDFTYKMLGYTPIELHNHTENHPNWNGVKDKKWVIDHIFPIKAFIDHDITDIKLINCLDNLQPLAFDENLKKAYTYDKSKFKEFLETKGIKIE